MYCKIDRYNYKIIISACYLIQSFTNPINFVLKDVKKLKIAFTTATSCELWSFSVNVLFYKCVDFRKQINFGK